MNSHLLTWIGASFLVTLVICSISILFIDLPLLQYLNKHAKPVEPVFQVITHIGDTRNWFLLSGSIFLSGIACRYIPAIKNSNANNFIKIGGAALTALAAAGIVVHLLKFCFGRWRPVYYLEEQIYAFSPFTPSYYKMASLPSGHAQIMATAMIMFLLFKPKLGRIMVPLVVLVAASRVVLNAHFLSDVVAGFWVGTAIPILLLYGWNNYCNKKQKESWKFLEY